MRILPLFGLLMIVSFPAYALSEEVVEITEYKTAVINDSGAQIGTALLEETPKGVLMTLDVSGLGEAGERAIHFHEKADCMPLAGNEEGKGPFTNTGGHYNPHENHHGFHHGEGAHAGDMPNLIVRADGTVKIKILNTFVTLHPIQQGDRAPLFDVDGSALIIHKGADDYVSQPTGDAGGRHACAVITNQIEAHKLHDHGHHGHHGHDHQGHDQGAKKKEAPDYLKVPMSIE